MKTDKKLINVKEAREFIQRDSRYSYVQTSDICSTKWLDSSDDGGVNSFINVDSVSKVSFLKNKYSQVSLGPNRIFHRIINTDEI